MRLQEHVRKAEVSLVQARLVVEHVETGGGDPSRSQRGDQCLVIDEIAARDVDDNGSAGISASLA